RWRLHFRRFFCRSSSFLRFFLTGFLFRRCSCLFLFWFLFLLFLFFLLLFSHDFLLYLSRLPPHFSHKRCFVPSSSFLCFTRVCLPHSGHIIIKFETRIGASRCVIPAWIPFCGFARVCFFVKLIPSTIARPFSG